ncbi:MAG: LPS assembly lipoprotein LptE [Phycisphaerales bacterium]
MIAGALGGCATDPREGYSTASTYPTEIESIAVPVFQNTTFARGLEVELTEALVAELRKSSPYRVVQSDSPQSTLRGTITGSDLRKLSTGRTSGLVEDLAVVLTVDFEWKDNRTGRVLSARRGFTTAEAFAPSRGVGERIETGQHAAVQEMARAIAGELRAGW